MYMLICCLIALSMIIPGVLIRELKAYNLIAGYNPLLIAEDSYDIQPVANMFGIVLYILAGLAILTGCVGHYLIDSGIIRDILICAYTLIVMITISVLVIVINKKCNGTMIFIFLVDLACGAVIALLLLSKYHGLCGAPGWFSELLDILSKKR